MQKGLIHIYTGDGKGKTTAALGLAVRACGRGALVLWTSFLKDYDSGEFKNAPFTLLTGAPVTKFWFMMSGDEKQATRQEHDDRLRAVFRQAAEMRADMLVLDETFGAIAVGALDEALVCQLLDQKPENLEVVMTGRDAPQSVVTRADYVSEIMARKHPFEQDVPARVFIEY